MRLRKSKRGQRGTQASDLSDLRELMKDRRLWAALAVVRKHDGEATHWEVAESKGQKHILVQVVTSPDDHPLVCRLSAAAGGLGMGLWRVPAEGVEVAVLIPSGEIDFQPTIVTCLDTGSPPTRVSPERTILVAIDSIELIAPLVYAGGVETAESTFKGESRWSAESTMLTALQAAFTALVAASSPSPLNALTAGFTSAETAITNFQAAAAAAANFLTTNAKVK